MNNNSELFNYSISNNKKEFQQNQLENIKKINSFDSDSIKRLQNNNKENEKPIINDTNNSLNPNIDKYKQAIIGGPRTEEKIVEKSKKNKNEIHEDYTKSKDNSMLINQIYNEKVKMNTMEIKSLLTGQSHNNKS